MTIELGGMPMLVDVRGNPVLYEGDVLAIYCDVQWEASSTGWIKKWTQPWIVTSVGDSGFTAKQPLSDDFEETDFQFGGVAIKLLARGGDDANAD